MDAFVPQNYSRTEEGLSIVHSNFVKSILDSKHLVTNQMIRKTIKIVVVRKKADSIKWQVEEILEVINN